MLFKRIKNLWRLSNLDTSLLQPGNETYKEVLKISENVEKFIHQKEKKKRMATIVEDVKPIFPQK